MNTQKDFEHWLKEVYCSPFPSKEDEDMDDSLIYRFEIIQKDDQLFLLARYQDFDFSTGYWNNQTTRKWYLSPHMTKSEFVQTCFKCVVTSMEHRAREMFKYRGKRVFGPHFNVDALHSICGQLDYRAPDKQDGHE